MDCTITQLVIRDSAVFNERPNSVVEVSGGPVFRFEIRSPRLAASIGSSLDVDHKWELTTLAIIQLSRQCLCFQEDQNLFLQKKLFQNFIFTLMCRCSFSQDSICASLWLNACLPWPPAVVRALPDPASVPSCPQLSQCPLRLGPARPNPGANPRAVRGPCSELILQHRKTL